MKKFVLLPEEKHRQAVEAMNASKTLTEANNSRDVLQSIQKPEQREMLKRYRVAQNTLHDLGGDRVEDEQKMNEYREAMQDFSLLRDRQGSDARQQQNAVTKNVESTTLKRVRAKQR